MNATIGLFRLLALSFVVSVLGLSAAAAEVVGSVSKVENQASVGGATAAVGTPVPMGAALKTGPKSRLQVTFKDNSTLTLGENAKVTVDKFAFNPKKSTGALALNAVHGAFRFTGGKVEQMKNKQVTVTTPTATLGIRGTDFWAGKINGKYGVLLVKGKVGVRGRGKAAR